MQKPGKKVLLIALIFLCAIIYSLADPEILEIFSRVTRENYNDLHQLIDPSKIVTFQGNTLPLDSLTPMATSEDCTNAAAPSVTEDPKDPHSLFEFAYNKCHSDCCRESSYGCDGGNGGSGCVCLTDKQKKFFGNRGGNRHITKCSSQDDIDY